jgi:hypothetical protein
MAELMKLIKESFDLSVKMRWLKEIKKAIDKREKLYEDYQRQGIIVSELVGRFKELYPDDKFMKIRHDIEKKYTKGGAE